MASGVEAGTYVFDAVVGIEDAARNRTTVPLPTGLPLTVGGSHLWDVTPTPEPSRLVTGGESWRPRVVVTDRGTGDRFRRGSASGT